MNETVSVMVPSRGGADRLPVLIDALSRQKDSPEFEVFVVVDEDVDGSERVLAALKEQHPHMPLDFEVFPENRGRVAALNRAAERTTGSVMVRCDDDLVPSPDYITNHAFAHVDAGSKGVIGLYRNVYPETPYARVYGRANDRLFRSQAYSSDTQMRWKYWAGNASVKRSTWDDVGSYDPDYRRYGWEDVDYGYRLHRAGVDVVLEQSLETEHRVAATTTVTRSLRALHSGAARQLFVEKHGAEVLDNLESARSPWGTAVKTSAFLSTERTIRLLGGGVDTAIRFLPKWVSRKSVALMVEGAGQAGIKYPERARDIF